MAKHPSPLLGYNNNVRHKNRIFHIQTEDSGVAHPHIITHLFMDGGRILKSLKRSYAEHVGADGMSEIVRGMMKEQHKAMFIALRDGQFDHLVTTHESSTAIPAVTPKDAPVKIVATPGAKAKPGLASGREASPEAVVAKAPTQGHLPKGTKSSPPAVPKTTSLGVAPPPAGAVAASAALPAAAAAAATAGPTAHARPPVAPTGGAGAPSAGAPPSGAPSSGAQSSPAPVTVQDPPRVPSPAAAAQGPHPSPKRPRSEPPAKKPSVPPYLMLADTDEVPTTARMHDLPGAKDLTLDLDALERAAAEAASASTLFQTSELPPPPRAMFAKELGTGAYRAVAEDDEGVRAPASIDKSRAPTRAGTLRPADARYAPARPAAIFGSPHKQAPPHSMFGDELLGDKSLDEVILSYLAEDLEPPRRK